MPKLLRVLTEVPAVADKVKFFDQVKEQPVVYATAAVAVGLVVAVVILATKKANKKKSKRK